MRLTVATLILAGLVAAHSNPAPRHEAVAKRHHRNRALTDIIFDGTHDLRDVPDNLEPPPEEEWDDSWFGNGPSDDNWTPEFDNSTEIVTVDKRTATPKQGIAWTNEVADGLAQFKGGKVFGLYTWTEWWPEDCKTYKIPFFPMLKTQAKKDTFKKAVVKGYGGGGWMMAMNEVNLASEANISPGTAAWLIRTYMLPLKSKGFKLVCPSTANGNSALTWYDSFRKQSDVWKQCDAIALHYYGLDYNLVIAWMKTWHSRYGKNIWLTEYGCNSFTGKGKCTQAQATTFMEQIAEFCQSQSWCTTHMVYGSYVNSRVGVAKVNALYSSANGTLSAFGKAFLAS